MAPSKRSVLHFTLLLALVLCAAVNAKKVPHSRRRGETHSHVRGDVHNKRILQETEVPVLLEVQGQPGLLSEFDYVVLEDTFVETFNALGQSLCPEGAPFVNTIAIDRNVANYVSPGDGTVSRIFTLSSRVSLPGDSAFFSTSQDIAARRLHKNHKQDISGPSRGLSRTGKGGKGSTSKSATQSSGTAIPVTTTDAAVAATTAPVDDGSTRTTCPGLTEEAFAAAYGAAVRAKSGELGTAVTDVTDVAEMGPTACAASTTDFSSDVTVTFRGDASLWSINQQQVLAESFGQTYRSLNSLNPDTCDPLFRDVFTTTVLRVDEFEFNRRLEEESSDNNNVAQQHRSLQARRNFSYLYRVTGQCRGCPSNSRLFAQGASGRRLLPRTAHAPFDFDRSRNLQDDTCMCPVTASETRAPTNEEFRVAYDADINILQEEGLINSAFIESVVDVREVQQVGYCGATETFETTVYVDLFGNPNTVTEGEIEALDIGFINTYESLSASFCDPFFRSPIEVTIDTVTRRGRGRRYLQSNFRYIYVVKGRCRGCTSNTRLFAQSVNRMLTSSVGGATQARRIQVQDNSLCFCTLDPIADRAPTEDEFAVAYNETVKDLGLPNILYVVNVEEEGYAVPAATTAEPPTTSWPVESTSAYAYLPTPRTTTSTSWPDGNEPTPVPTEGVALTTPPPAEISSGGTEPTSKPTCIHVQ